eukprot:12938804-Prorocentrum_lima.AAC.1
MLENKNLTKTCRKSMATTMSSKTMAYGTIIGEATGEGDHGLQEDPHNDEDEDNIDPIAGSTMQVLKNHPNSPT